VGVKGAEVLKYAARPVRRSQEGEGGRASVNIAHALAWVGFYNAIGLKERRSGGGITSSKKTVVREWATAGWLI
jgi:hypothetical protein